MTGTEKLLLLAAGGLAVAAFFYATRPMGPPTPGGGELATDVFPTTIIGANSIGAGGGMRCGRAGSQPGKGVRCCNGIDPNTLLCL